jgi:RNA recognition motif-containing protein
VHYRIQIPNHGWFDSLSTRQLFIARIPPDINEEDLKVELNHYNPSSVYIIKDQKTGEPRGCVVWLC